MESNQIVLNCNELSIGYDQALITPLSFSLLKSEILHIKGQNGSGKSTLIKTLLKLTPKIGGDFKWFTQEESISYLPQISASTNLFSYSVLEILETYRIPREYYLLLPTDLLERKWINLSGGEKQKVILLTRVQNITEVLILDEPFNHLDQKSIEDVTNFISKLRQLRTMTMIIVSHQNLHIENLKTVELC